MPTDILTRVAAFACDDELARLALSAKSALAALDNQQIWAATLRTNHGGLRIRAEPSGLRAAARLASARTNKGPVYGCHALASDVTSWNSDAYWADAMFQPEPYRVFYSATVGGERLLCAATFLTGVTHDPDRQWMLDTLREYVNALHLERTFEWCTLSQSPWRRSSCETSIQLEYVNDRSSSTTTRGGSSKSAERSRTASQLASLASGLGSTRPSLRSATMAWRWTRASRRCAAARARPPLSRRRSSSAGRRATPRVLAACSCCLAVAARRAPPIWLVRSSWRSERRRIVASSWKTQTWVTFRFGEGSGWRISE